MKCFNLSRFFALAASLALAGFVSSPARAADKPPMTTKWQRYEVVLESAAAYDNPVQQATLTAIFASPLGETYKVLGFWDGGKTWRVRFAPNQIGEWSYVTTCSDEKNGGLHQKTGKLLVTAASNKTRFDQHGPLRVSPDGRYLMHEDRTPFFWLADTCWNGAMLSTPGEWDQYIRERTRQKFTAVQFVATQFRAAPDGDREHQVAFTGTDKIVINHGFFQKLDEKIDALNKNGLLAVPVMLWAINGGANPKVNPGFALSEAQAIILGRYMVARWGANDVSWILGGDADYRGDKAERWKNIGRGIFVDIPHAPVTMHPGGMQWVWREFLGETWFNFLGYQSGHGDDDKTLRWITEGPLNDDWTKLPHRPFINLEPPYENHLGYQSKKPHTADSVRRAMYWSLLNTPTAGITYGGHGVWGWDDGTKAPTDHAGTGTPLPWAKALTMPGAEQMAHLHDFFTSLDFWRLRPASVIVKGQPGKEHPEKFIAAAKTDQKDICVVYVPEDRTVEIKLDALPPSPNVTWINPRTGEKSPAVAVVTTDSCQFPTPAEGDWILLMKTEKKEAEAPKDAKEPAQPKDK